MSATCSRLLAICLLFSLSACHLLEVSNNNNSNASSGSATATASAYIERFKPIAIAEMKRTGVPASIKMAQAILESGYGRSELAKKANNHFGIKCGSNWNGKTYKLKASCFRAYSSAEESFKQHSDFLRNGSRYADLFKLKTTDYKGWAKGLRKAGYATSSSYPSKLIELIERYRLHQYDQ
ncbi:glucosaminidase domain-containing protein [Saprospira sp. CCB-QB6]|uniref:glycoside hydrolase family 73 protein n=1 Tax=Saprospira sp. CCB-QB6 TaxID=3023936 RepID=UPI00234B73B0|nr:glucosaminidase domain-containing protein [Saprospira sp. CCB-QB6]WCL82003.1 glucosaminidase domain-containing protein [Saprospira sp. CCB-QB6]